MPLRIAHTDPEIKNNWDKISIPSCTALEVILFDLECRRCSATEYPIALRTAFDAYVAALRHPDVRGRSTLKTIVLRATVYTMDNPIFGLDWESMDRALDKLPTVETVFFGFTWDSLTPFSQLSALLPRTQKSGRLFARLDLVRCIVWTCMRAVG